MVNYPSLSLHPLPPSPSRLVHCLITTSSPLCHHDIMCNLTDTRSTDRPRKWGYDPGMWEKEEKKRENQCTAPPPSFCPPPFQFFLSAEQGAPFSSSSMTDSSIKVLEKPGLSGEVTLTQSTNRRKTTELFLLLFMSHFYKEGFRALKSPQM